MHVKQFPFVGSHVLHSSLHLVHFSLPGFDAYVPDTQFVHVVDSPPDEYVPLPHNLHVFPSNLYPTSQVKQFPFVESHFLQTELHFVHTIAPPVEYSPVAQSSQYCRLTKR